ncbi:MAG TPA: pitrilysin family protein [Kofleriaceae bacterium]
MTSRLPAALTLLRAAAIAAPLSAAPALDPESLRVAHERFTLPNGLTVLVHEDHSNPIVAVNLWYHVGSQNERRGRTGFAHLFEHFFFNGSENYPHGFREAMDDLGANNRNGTTSTDRTNFFEDVPVGALERTLYLEADRMGYLAGNLSQEMLERERGVVSNEKRQGDNQPYGRVFDRMVQAMYPASHPYSWPTIGSLEDLAAATLPDVKTWYQTYYGPNNCVLSLAGDITPARARELVEKYFGGIPPGPALERYVAWTPKLERDLRDTMQDRVPQTRVYRAWHAPRWGDPELAQLELAMGALAGSRSSRLDRRVIYGRQLATEVGAFVSDGEIASTLILFATLKSGVEPAEVEREMDAMVAELVAKGPTSDELERGRTRIFAGMARGLERLGGFGGRSDVLAESQTFGGSPDAYLERLRRLRAATPETVRAAAKTWMTQPSYTLVVEPMAPLVAGETAVDRKVVPALGGASDPTFPKVERATLANGLKIMLLERRGVPLVNLALAVDAGSASDTGERAGLASFALDLLDDGTTTRDVFAIEDALDSLGAQVTTDTGLDLSFVRLRALQPNFAQSLDLFADMVRNPSFPADVVALEKKVRLARIEQEKAAPVSAALRLLPGILYGAEHPYGKPLTGSGTPAAVEALTREELAAWHRSWFKPGSATLIATGAISMADLQREVERVFGSWPSGEAPKKDVAAAGTGVRRRLYLVDKPDAPQSVIVAAHVSEAGGRAEDLAMEVVMRDFGGMATSRLNRNLRLDKHWSYGTSGQLVRSRGARPFVVVAPVQTDKTKEALAEVIKEIDGIAGDRPISGEEFSSILRNMTLRLPGRFETLAAVESAAVDMVQLGYPEEFFSNYSANVRGLGERDLAAAAKAFIRPGEVVWLVVGDLAKIEAGLRELDLGEVVRTELK